MDHHDHVALIRAAVRPGETWADLGSGDGAFTLALAELLGADGAIVSVDRDGGALTEQQRRIEAAFPAVAVRYVAADFRRALELPPLDGFVMANSLHFVPPPDQVPVLARLVSALRDGGRVVVVEYDAESGNRWVPHPIAARRWPAVAEAAGLAEPREIGRRPSRFLGAIYSGVAYRGVR
jgi:ubiquinone/menaquinone biosynthesis C-methylase UbiE